MPFSTPFTSSGLLIAWATAWRTRMSLNGGTDRFMPM